MPTTPDARDRINTAAREAVRDPTIKGRAAQVKFMENRCRRDAGMLWELLGKYFDAAVEPILEAEAAKLSKPRRRGEAVPLDVSEAGKRLGEWKGTGVPGQKTKRPTGEEARGGKIQSVWTALAKSIPVRINGKPVWDVSVREAYNWLLTNKRDGRFVELMISGLPITSDLVGFYRNDNNEIQEFYNQVEKERKAA